MSDQDENFDEEVTASTWESETDNNESGEVENNESSAKKNNSNFKALYKSNKEKEQLLAEKNSELEKVRAELDEWRNLNPDTVEELDSKKDISSVKEEIFSMKNPEAETHMTDIRKTMSEYGMDINKAWKFVKMDIPEESKTTKEFSVWKTALPKTTDFTKISDSDSLNLSPTDRAKWRKANWWG